MISILDGCKDADDFSESKQVQTSKRPFTVKSMGYKDINKNLSVMGAIDKLKRVSKKWIY